MTKKHYISIAKIISERLNNVKNLDAQLEAANIASRLATYLQAENPNFNRERFLSACGVRE